MAFWIVCHHCAPKLGSPSLLDAFVLRVDVCVEFFMILSGFLTEHLYGEAELSDSWESIATFYVRRLGRVLMVSYVGMCLSLLLSWVNSDPIFTWHNAMCFLFVKPWLDPMPDCPDMPTWFVAALLPSWLLYPLVTQQIVFAACQRGWLHYLTFLLWLLAAGPSLLLLAWRGSWLTWEQVTYTWFWPPAQLADFGLGVCVAVAVRQAPPGKKGGILADVAFLSILAICVLLPVPSVPEGWTGPSWWQPGHYMRWDQLTARFSAPMLMAWLYYSIGGGSCSARLLGSPGLVALGSYSLEVYLFQTPLRDGLRWLEAPQGALWQGLPWTNEVFIAYLLVLWFTSGFFVELIAGPATQRLRQRVAAWNARPGYRAVSRGGI